MEKIFKDKVAIVTGGVSGIGRATVVEFAQGGAKVVVADMRDGKKLVAEIKKAGGEAIYIKCDVSKEADVKAMVRKTVATYGRLDYAVNNAGTEGIECSTQELTEEIWQRTIDINLKGVWLCMKYEIRQMLKQGKGAIVNTASIAGVIAFQNSAAYVASKHGVIGLTKAAALENAQTGIRVNAVCPGLIRTPMLERAFIGNPQMEEAYTAAVPMKRLGRPEEIADSIIHLCSDASSLITGSTLVIDGGWVAQ